MARAQSTLVITEGDAARAVLQADTAQFRSALENETWEYIVAGHVFASWDTLRFNGDSLVVRLVPGTRYDLAVEPPSPLDKSRMLRPFINRGYPFAKVLLDSVGLSDGKVGLSLRVDPGPEITFDSVSHRQPVKLSSKYVYHTLRFRPGDPYSEKVFQAMPKRLRRLPQIESQTNPDVGFESGGATIFLDLVDRNSDSFEGILGLLNNQGEGATVTGYLKLDLNNLFSSGKELHIDWNRFAEQSQDLDVSYVHPYLFGSEFKLSAGLGLLRQDTAFSSRHVNLGLQFPITPDLDLGVAYQQHVSDLTGEEPDTRQGLDYTNNAYRAQINWQQRMQPITEYRSFIGSFVSLEIGDKKIRQNARVPEEAYDTLTLRSTNYQWDFELTGQLTFARQSALFGHLRLGTVRGPEILRNEYYRVGGLRSFRGFNENEFFAQALAILQSEYRLYFDRSSYLLALVDMGFLRTDLADNFLMGYGLGIALDTQAGNFQLIFALGNTEDTQPDIRNVKAHFGYTARF